jgi:hypothetical protein
MPTNKPRVPVILDTFHEPAKQRAAEEGCSLSEYIRRLIYLDIQGTSAGSSSNNINFENKKTNTL